MHLMGNLGGNGTTIAFGGASLGGLISLDTIARSNTDIETSEISLLLAVFLKASDSSVL